MFQLSITVWAFYLKCKMFLIMMSKIHTCHAMHSNESHLWTSTTFCKAQSASQHLQTPFHCMKLSWPGSFSKSLQLSPEFDTKIRIMDSKILWSFIWYVLSFKHVWECFMYVGERWFLHLQKQSQNITVSKCGVRNTNVNINIYQSPRTYRRAWKA